MSENFHAGDALAAAPRQEERFQSGPNDNIMATMAVQMHAQLKDHDKAIATHDGLIKGIQTAISSVQGSVAAVLTIGGIATAALIAVAIFNLNRTNSVGDRLDTLSTSTGTRLAGIEVRAGAIESRLSVLPQEVARELREQPAPVNPPPSAQQPATR